MKLVHVSIFASSFKFLPNKIFLTSRITPSDSSLEVLIKYFTIGIAPVKKSSPDLSTGNVLVGLYSNISLLGLFNFIIFGGKGRNLVTNSINLQRVQFSKANNTSFVVSTVTIDYLNINNIF